MTSNRMVLIKLVFLTVLLFGVIESQPLKSNETTPRHREVVTGSQEEEEVVSPYIVNIAIIILNQNHTAHVKRAEKLRENLMIQASKNQRKQFRVALLYPELIELLHSSGPWTVLPLAKSLIDEFKPANWFFFVNEFVSINIDKLFKELLKFNAVTKALFLGRAVRDNLPSPLHHLQINDGVDGNSLEYPEFSAGFLMSKHLLAHLIDKGDYTMHLSDTNNLDVNYELAKLILEKFSYRVPLKNVPHLCGANWREFDDKQVLNCITEMNWEDWMESNPLPAKEICYAVKTHSGNHQTRLNTLKETWAKPGEFKSRIKFYSDVADDEVGTVQVPVTIPNVERGHCEKSLHILRDFHENDSKFCKWLVIVDDDSLINTKRLAQVLKRYSEMTQVVDSGVDRDTGKRTSKVFSDVEALAVGDRKGFFHWPVIENNTDHAYDFLAGGAGMAFSRTAVGRMFDYCYCGLRDPDDMLLGLCMTRLKIPIIHNPLFHQSSPLAYPWESLRYQKPVSFHSFDDIDPKGVYENYLVPETPKKYLPNMEFQQPYTAPPMYQATTLPPNYPTPPPVVDIDGNIIERNEDEPVNVVGGHNFMTATTPMPPTTTSVYVAEGNMTSSHETTPLPPNDGGDVKEDQPPQVADDNKDQAGDSGIVFGDPSKPAYTVKDPIHLHEEL